MLREQRRENLRLSRSEDDTTADRVINNRSNYRHLHRSRSEIVLVPPIRSLSTRDPLHHTSNATLRVGTDGQGPDECRTGVGADPATTITQAIAQLEKTLEEACRLVQSVGEIDHRNPTPPRMPESKKRRLSESIAYKSLKYLEHAKKCELPACGPAHRDRAPMKSRLAMAQVAHPLGALELEHEERLEETTLRPKTGLEILSPPPVQTRRTSHNRPKVRVAEHDAFPSKADVKAYIRSHAEPPISSRISSQSNNPSANRPSVLQIPPLLKLNDRDMPKEEETDQRDLAYQSSFSRMFGIRSRHTSVETGPTPTSNAHAINLKGVCHVDVLNKPNGFDVFDTCTHATVARDWPTSRKRFTATIVCLNTICVGTLVGIYAGEVPAMQYRIADFGHYTILGNVVLYCGLAISTILFWPLPLLHGRKPYTVMGFALTFGLQIPQGIAVADFRMPGDMRWRVLLLLSRALSGFALGLVNINLQSTMLDLFGSSLQSQHPHGGKVDPYDVRRHGGGMGLWLAAWSWCSIGSISCGFVIGAFIVENTSVDWGFWTAVLLLMFIMALNVVTPEVRRSAFRRTIAEFIGQEGSFSRVARGEIKMHLEGNGPYWWGEEVHAGLQMSWLMIKQPGFLVLAAYSAWAYAQFTLVIMLLGALASKDYNYRPVLVGVCVLSLVIGSLLAVPFQKASFLSRFRTQPPRTDSMTFQRSLFWTSHLVRRCLFMVLLPLAALGYALSSWGPPLPMAVPCVFSAIVACTSNLAIAECFGLVMETFDTSDLQPGMKGRPVRRRTLNRLAGLRTNFSCHPRVSAGMAVTQSLQFGFAAAATGLGGRVERRLGAVQASLAVAGVLLGLTLLLTLVLWRLKTVQLIPGRPHSDEQLPRHQTDWEPVILGQPSGITRKLSMLEAGRQTRWSEIRRRNRLNTGLTGS